ncbi:unnamed protein product [Hanseniaspora opuntiae]
MKEQDVQNDNMNTDEETLTAEKNDELFTSEQSKDYVLNKKTLDNMRIPSINSLPSFSFSYSFVSSSETENMDKHSQLSITAAESLLNLTRK